MGTCRASDHFIDIFLRASDVTNPNTRLVNAFQGVLLSETLKKAFLHSAYWRDHIGSAIEKKCPWESLSLIQPSTREDLQQNYPSTLTDDAPPKMVLHTTGTTGSQYYINRNEKEISFLDSLYKGIQRRIRSNIQKPIIISTLDQIYHGGSIVTESYGYKIFIGTEFSRDFNDASEIADILLKKHSIQGFEERVSVIGTTAQFLVFLTQWLIDHGIDPQETGVRQIFHGSSYLSNSKRKWIKDLWKAQTYNVYSSAEMVGRAVETENQGLAFQVFNIIEILDPWTYEVIEEGIGILTVTCLYPFVQLQPRIRYLTNDLFQVWKTEKGNKAFRFIGRIENSAPEQYGTQTRPCIPPVFVYDVLDALHEVSRQPSCQGMASMPKETWLKIGRPTFRCAFETFSGKAAIVYFEMEESRKSYNSVEELVASKVYAEAQRLGLTENRPWIKYLARAVLPDSLGKLHPKV